MDQLPAPRSSRGTILVYALNRWQTLAIVVATCVGIAVTILLLEANLPLILFWAGFGVVGTAAMVVVSFRDAESVDEALITRADLAELKDRRLRQLVERAAAYQRSMRRAVRETDSPELRGALDLITREVADPVGLIFNLARRLEAYRDDPLIHEDLRRLSAARQELNEAEQAQLANLQRLQRLMAEAENAVDAALAQLGASYSAVQLARAGGELKSATAQHALGDLRAQSEQLRDLNDSLDEVFAQRERGGI